MNSEEQEDMKIVPNEGAQCTLESNMLLLSKEFPLVTFKLYAYDEDARCKWNYYYRNGEQCNTIPVELSHFSEKDFDNLVQSEVLPKKRFVARC